MSSNQSLTDPTNDADRVRVASIAHVPTVVDIWLTDVSPDPHEAVSKAAASVVHECFSFALYHFFLTATSSAHSQT